MSAVDMLAVALLALAQELALALARPHVCRRTQALQHAVGWSLEQGKALDSELELGQALALAVGPAPVLELAS